MQTGWPFVRHRIVGVLQRFCHAFGTPNLATVASLCEASGRMGKALTCGSKYWADINHSRTLVVWGANPFGLRATLRAARRSDVASRTKPDRHRHAPNATRRKSRDIPAAAPGYRRCARARHDARHHRGGAARRLLHRAVRQRIHQAANAPPFVRPRHRVRDNERAGQRNRPGRADVRKRDAHQRLGRSRPRAP